MAGVPKNVWVPTALALGTACNVAAAIMLISDNLYWAAFPPAGFALFGVPWLVSWLRRDRSSVILGPPTIAGHPAFLVVGYLVASIFILNGVSQAFQSNWADSLAAFGLGLTFFGLGELNAAGRQRYLMSPRRGV